MLPRDPGRSRGGDESVTQFVHEATVELADGADPRALGGAITVALCGHWEHEPPCPWPHHTDISAVERPSGADRVRRCARRRAARAAADRRGTRVGPTGRPRWAGQLLDAARVEFQAGSRFDKGAGRWPGAIDLTLKAMRGPTPLARGPSTCTNGCNAALLIEWGSSVGHGSDQFGKRWPSRITGLAQLLGAVVQGVGLHRLEHQPTGFRGPAMASLGQSKQGIHRRSWRGRPPPGSRGSAERYRGSRPIDRRTSNRLIDRC